VLKRGDAKIGGASLELRGLTKHFAGHTAVDGISVAIETGSFVTLLGPSGCGKTTTLMMLAGFVEPSAGQILIGGTDITALPANKRNVGMVFQNYALFPHLSVFDNVAFPLKMRRVPKAQIRTRVEAVLDMVGMAKMAGRRPNQLSGGQQQRIALARTIVFEPRVLLMDEPLSALDRKLRDQMRFEIKTLQQQLEATVIYVTHDQEEALAISDQVIVMNEGRIEQVDTPENIYQRPASRFVADFVGEASFLLAEVREITPAGCSIALGTGELISVASDEGRRPKKGDKGILVIRPESAQIVARPTPNCIKGIVMNRTFLGESVRYTLKLGSGELLIVKTSSRQLGSTQLSNGDSADIEIFPADVRLLPTDGGSNART